MHGAPRNRFSRVPLDSLCSPSAPLVHAKKHHFGCYIWQLMQTLCLSVKNDQADKTSDTKKPKAEDSSHVICRTALPDLVQGIRALSPATCGYRCPMNARGTPNDRSSATWRCSGCVEKWELSGLGALGQSGGGGGECG